MYSYPIYSNKSREGFCEYAEASAMVLLNNRKRNNCYNEGKSLSTVHKHLLLRAKKSWAYGILLLCFFLYIPATALATTGAISQSYNTSSTNITQGALLSLTSSNSGVVVPANGNNNAANLVGVAASKPLLELSSSNQHSIQVVVGGTAMALVSNINGLVKVGDKIAASPVSGIGMKATSSSEIVGVAQANLSSVKTVTQSYAGTEGKTLRASIGLLPISVNVAYYSTAASGGSVSAFVPPFLQSVANAVAGKSISPLRVLIGTLTLLLGFVTIVIMLSVGIRSGVISLGRNPLAENALRRGMIDILLTALGVLVVTGVVVSAVVLA